MSTTLTAADVDDEADGQADTIADTITSYDAALSLADTALETGDYELATTLTERAAELRDN